MTDPRTAVLAVLATALASLTVGCDTPASAPSPTVSTPASSVPTPTAPAAASPSASPTVQSLAKTPKTQRHEVARSVVDSTSQPPTASSVAGPDDVSGHYQQLSGACVDAEGGAFAYQVLDASAKAKGSVAERTIATGSLACDGRVHRQRLDVSRSEVVQLTVNGGLDNDDARGWLIITNGDAKLR